MPLDRTAPVAVFDSGAGGIGVLREVKKVLPNEDFFYFGDTANAPYGEKSTEAVRTLVLLHAARLLAFSKALVLACNTATAAAVSLLRARYPGVPIVGMEPALKPAVTAFPQGPLLVLATATTLRERKFARLLARFSETPVYPVAAGGLVRLVENGLADSPQAEAYLAAILAPFGGIRFAAAVLGCTHFPFAAPAIRRVLGDIPLFDGAGGAARQLAGCLAAADLLSPQNTPGTVTLASSAPASLDLYRALLLA